MINRAIMFSKFIKYELLDSLLNTNPSTQVMLQKPIDIFIDFQSVYKNILNANFFNEDEKILSINVLNLAAHYRHYFRKRLNTKVRVFIVNSTSRALVGNLCEIYNFENKDMFKSIEKIVKYIPDVFYITRENQFGSVVISELITRYTNDNAKFVLSNDSYSYQLPSIYPNTFVLRPGMKPKLITSNNVIDTWSDGKKTITSDFNPNLLPLIMAHYKCVSLGIPLLYNYPKAVDLVRAELSRGYIINGYNIPNTAFEEQVKKLGIPSMGLTARWSICDLMTQSIGYLNSPESLDTTWQVKYKCDFAELASAIDSGINMIDPDNMLNYVFLLD